MTAAASDGAPAEDRAPGADGPAASDSALASAPSSPTTATPAVPSAATPSTGAAHLVPAPAARDVRARWMRPVGMREVRGMTWAGDRLLVLDARTGMLAQADPTDDSTWVVNDGHAEQFRGGRGLAADADSVWLTTERGLHRAPWATVAPTGSRPGMSVGAAELVLPVEDAHGVAVHGDELYLVVGSTLHVMSPPTQPTSLAESSLRMVEVHGVGACSASATPSRIWLCDDVEQTVYALDRHTLRTLFRVLAPLEGPCAIAARPAPARDHAEDNGDGSANGAGPAAGNGQDAAHDQVLLAFHEREPYLFDNPYIDPCWEARYRDRVVLHELHHHLDPTARIAWSTGHRVQMHYFVVLDPDRDAFDEVESGALLDIEWRISLPIDSPRQRLVNAQPIGLPFDIEHEDDLTGRPQPVAVFRIPRLDTDSRLVLGWRATVELFGVKHQLGPADLAEAPGLPAELAARYLIDDEDLDLDSPEVAAATTTAIGEETNLLQQARRIRSHVYDLLEYEMGNADSPVEVMARGTGSCGEHVGTIMALMRRAGIACRVAGRYKVPYFPWDTGPLYPDYNHVWVDLYLPGHGWVPVESNPDDVRPGGPYPDRFFMGLPWRHIELGKDISFEKVLHRTTGRWRRIGARRLSRNNIRFDVLSEIAPGPHDS